MITVEKILALQRVSLFSDLDAAALGRIAEIAEEVIFPAGSTVFAQGEPGRGMYLIQEGRVRIHKGESEVSLLREPGYFGELSLLADEPRIASATAVTDCLLLRIETDGFREILMAYPQAALDIIRTLRGYLPG